MKTAAKFLMMICLIGSTLISCRNNEPRDTESGQGDNFDRNHPMETEGTNEPETDTTGNAPTQTSPTNN